MRLKVLFAPLIFLLVIVIVIWFIWPSIGDVMERMAQLKLSKGNLSTASEKRNTLENIKSMLDKNKDKEDFVLNFLPQSKSEEKIIDGINYLAADSGLSLINVSLAEEKEIDPTLAANTMAVSTINESTSSTAPLSADGSVIPKPAAKIKNVTAKAVLSGKYENIKLFLGQIYRMQMNNSINSVSISKQDQGSADQPASDVLMATVEINFGYMKPVNAQLNENSTESLNLDLSLYSKLKDAISEKIPVLDEGERGKVNPFIP